MRELLSAAALTLALVSPALASPVAPGFDSSSLGRADDFYADAALPFTANFLGTSWNSLSVSNNGYVTFGGGQTNYAPVGLGASYVGNAIIAPFYDDVDTRNPASGVVSYGTGSYAGHTAFGATWAGVGYYEQQVDKLDTFQVILADRSDVGAGNFDIYFNYGSIQWDASADTQSAAVGYNAATTGDAGTFYQLDGSLISGAFVDGGPNALSTGTNDGVLGQYAFTVRNGNVSAGNDVPEPATIALLSAGLLAMALVSRPKHI